MATLGELERSVMDVLWDSPTALTATELRDRLRDGRNAPFAAGGSGSTGVVRGKNLATTTILTVLSRLENKGFVTRDRDGRPHVYSATTGRADHMAELMHEVLGAARDREAVLARFVGQVSPDEAAALRRMLDGS
ncbi:MAG TPA: BlaI/MecI/CopY family transcriptional regulator [Microbacteriaceae bacterium]